MVEENAARTETADLLSVDEERPPQAIERGSSKPPRRLPGMGQGIDLVRRTFEISLYIGLAAPPIMVASLALPHLPISVGFTVMAVMIAATLALIPVLQETFRVFPWRWRMRPSRRATLILVVLLLVTALTVMWLLPQDREWAGGALIAGMSLLFIGYGGYVGPVLWLGLQLLIFVIYRCIVGPEVEGLRMMMFSILMAACWGTVWSSLWYLEIMRNLDRTRRRDAELAVAEERLRIARDLHDVLGRRFSAIAVKSELGAALAQREGGAESAAGAQLAEIRELSHESLTDMRRLVQSYRAADLEQELAGARSLLSSAGIEVSVTGGTSAIPARHRDAIAAVLREAVTNVLRHSTAERVEITVDGAGLRIANDGASERAPSDDGIAGSGLDGLRERLAQTGGSLNVSESAGRFRVEARLPNDEGESR